MSDVFYSAFFPDETSFGVKGTTMPAVSGDTVVDIVKETPLGEGNLSSEFSFISNVSALPTTKLFEGRMVYYQGKLWTYKDGAWVPTIASEQEANDSGIINVDTLPTVAEKGNVVFLNTDSKLYRFDGQQWTSAVASTDITGFLASSNFPPNLQPVETVNVLPTTNLFVGRVVYLLADDALYTYDGTKWSTTGLIDGAVTIDKLAPNIKAVEIVTTLPAPPHQAGRLVFLQSDQKLYRNTGNGWTAAVASSDIAGQLTNSQIADAAISTAKFANGLRPVEIVSVLPTTDNVQGRTVVLTTDNKLYRYNGTAWTAAVSTNDLNGQISSEQIASITANKISDTLAASQIPGLDASKITSGSLTLGAIPALPADKIISGTLSIDRIPALDSSKIANNAITNEKLAPNLAGIESVSALPSTANFRGRTVMLQSDGKLYRWNSTTTTGTASWVKSVDTTDLSGTVQGVQIAANSIEANHIKTGTITGDKLVAGTVQASQIGANQINAKHLIVADLTNLVPNGGIESDDLSMWGAPSDGTITTTTDYSPLTGNRSLVLTKTALTSSANVITRPEWRIPVTAGEVLYAEVTYKGNSAATQGFYYRLNWFKADNTPATPTNNDVVGNGAITTSWKTDGAKITVPANASFVRVQIYNHSTQNTALSVIVNNLTLRRANASNLIVDGSIVATQLAANTITANQIATNAITADELAANSVIAAKISANAVTTDKLDANAVTAPKIAANTITAAQIASNTITATQIATGAITANELAANAVISTSILAGAITTDKLAANAVTAAKIAANTITANEIATNAITTAKIMAGAVTSTEIAAGAITASKLFIGDTTNIVDNGWTQGSQDGWKFNSQVHWIQKVDNPSVNGWEFASTARDQALSQKFSVRPGEAYYMEVWVYNTESTNANIFAFGYPRLDTDAGYFAYPVIGTSIKNTWVKISGLFMVPEGVTALRMVLQSDRASSGGNITAWSKPIARRAMTGELIVDGAITASKIAANSITSNEIATNSITSNELAANSVTSGHIVGGTITATELASNSVTSVKIAADSVTTAKIATGAITATEIAGSTITADKLVTGTITSAYIAAGAITASKLLIGDTTNIVDNGWTQGSQDGWQFNNQVHWLLKTNDPNTNGWEFGSIGRDQALSQKFSVRPGEAYYTEVWVYNTQANDANILMFAYPRLDTDAGAAVHPVIGTSIKNTWVKISGLYTVPEGVTALRMVLQSDRTSGTGTVTAWSKPIARRAMTGELIVDGAITANKIAASTITGDKIVGGTITGAKIAANTITGDRIAANTIISDNIQAGAVSAGKIGVTQLSAINSNMGNITAGSMNINGRTLLGSDGNIQIRSGDKGVIMGSNMGKTGDLVMYVGPRDDNLGLLDKNNAAFYLDQNGNGGFSGIVRSSLISASAIELGSTRIHCGSGRLAPFIITEIANARSANNNSPGNLTATISGFISPDNGSGYNSKRFARHKMDVMLEAFVYGDFYMNYLYIDVMFNNDGNWMNIGSTSGEMGGRASQQLAMRYTSYDSSPSPWSQCAFRARTTGDSTLSLLLRVTVLNFNESGNEQNTNSGTNTGSGAGGAPPSTGGGGGTYCVDYETTVLPDGRFVRDLQIGDVVDAWNESGKHPEVVQVPVRNMDFGHEESYKITTETGVSIIQSASTPMTMRDGGVMYTPHLLNEDVLVNRNDTLAWEKVTSLEAVGVRKVVKATMLDSMYFAGMSANATIATHNAPMKRDEFILP